MTTLDILRRLQRMDQLIRLKATGSPLDFAAKLEISKSKLYNDLQALRDLGAEISFCKDCGSYFYKHPPQFEFGTKNR